MTSLLHRLSAAWRSPQHSDVRNGAILRTQTVKTNAAGSLLLLLAVAACTEAGSTVPSPGSLSLEVGEPSPAASDLAAAVMEPLRLVSLGDAYTAGTLTPGPKRDSWPAQLEQAMDDGSVRLDLIANLAENSQTSADVLDGQVSQVRSWRPDVVTVQVGVNDIIAEGIDGYDDNVSAIFDELLTILPPGRIFAVTTPDHSLTVRGSTDFAPDARGGAVLEVNRILREVARERGIVVIDISGVNRLAAADASLTIDDGPYPSAKQYAGWVEVIGPAITQALLAPQP